MSEYRLPQLDYTQADWVRTMRNNIQWANECEQGMDRIAIKYCLQIYRQTLADLTRKPKVLYEGDSLIQTVKMNNPIIEVINKYTTLRKTGSTWVGKCPIHHEKEASLTVYPDEGKFHCYGCLAHGDVVDFIKAIESVDTSQALEILGTPKPNKRKGVSLCSTP